MASNSLRVVLLGPIDDLGEERDGPLLPIDNLAEDTSRGYIRRICVQNAGDVWPRVLQGRCLHERPFQPIKRLLHLICPSEGIVFTGATRQWLCNFAKSLINRV